MSALLTLMIIMLHWKDKAHCRQGNKKIIMQCAYMSSTTAYRAQTTLCSLILIQTLDKELNSC